MPFIEEILGFNSSKNNDSESVTRRFYVSADTPEEAKSAFENFANGLSTPDGLELGNVDIDEEKNANGLYFATITFTLPNPKIKNKINDDLFEIYGEKIAEGRKSTSRERRFRIKATTAFQAGTILENYIRNDSPTSGRLHISDINVDEEQNGNGYFTGTVIYNNPDHKGFSDQFSGYVPAYGNRWLEQYDKGTHTASTAEDVFELRGYASAYEALQALKASHQNIYVKEISVEEDSNGADRIYVGRIRRTEEKEESDTLRSVSFEVSGSQTKMTHSLSTRGAWAANNASPRNYGGLIGVTDDGVEGVDIDTVVSTFSETVYFYPWFLTTSYIAFLARAYGCVNNMPFRGFAPGEVRFLGTSGAYRQGDKAAELTFKFAVSPNAQNIRVGDMTIPFKYGWDYLWVRWADMKQDNVTVKVPIEAYVEQVYQGLNFITLGIGI
jgi:hypothetical protein